MTGKLRKLALLVILMSVGGSLLPGTSAAITSVPTYPATGSLDKRFGPLYMGGRVAVTSTQAVEIAKRFDVLAVVSGTFAGQVSAMRTANQNLRILVYTNASFVHKDKGPASGTYPKSWYARDNAGRYIQSNNFGSWLMDISNPNWKSTVAKKCDDAMADNPGYSGCFLDMLGPAPITGDYCTSLAINPATGEVWSRRAWLRETAETASTVQSANPTLIIGGNGLASGGQYFDTSGPTSALWPGITGGIAELFVRHSSDGVYEHRSTTAWLEDLKMLVDAGARGESVLAVTKLWVDATAAQKKAWEKYAFATFMLGTNGRQYFSFSGAKTWADLTANRPVQDVNVGAIVEPYTISEGGVYKRVFTKGIAVVNPTSSAISVALGGVYNVNGTASTRIRLGPHSGEVLTAA